MNRKSSIQTLVETTSPTNKQRRPSSTLLHPDHARLLPIPLPNRSQLSSDQSSNEDLTEYFSNGSITKTEYGNQLCTESSSTTSSMTSIAGFNKNHR